MSRPLAPIAPTVDPGYELRLRSARRWRALTLGAGLCIGGVVGQMFARRFGNGTPEQEAAFFSVGIGLGFTLAMIYVDEKGIDEERAAATNAVADVRSRSFFSGPSVLGGGPRPGLEGIREGGPWNQGPIRTNVAPTESGSPVRRGS